MGCTGEMKISCGIVSFNPDIDLLQSNIEAIKSQVEQIFVVDNGSDNVNAVENLADQYCSVQLIKNTENRGIAAALNQCCEASAEDGCHWIVTLDQDSVCPEHFVDGLSQFIDVEEKVGIVAPLVVDRSVGVIGHHPTGYSEVRTCITSGALTNLDLWKKLDGFDEQMFIDSVDFEYCYRVRKAGYKVIQTDQVQLSHSIGNASMCRFLFWKFKNMEHSAFRDYYIAQNNVYYPRKHKLWIHFLRGNARNLKSVFIVCFYEDDRVAKVKAIIRGWHKGLIMRSDG
jgi:rhamnosyltransferase